MAPDLERVLVAYLRADEIVAIITDRIGTRTPPNLDDPWVRITLLDDRDHPRSSAQHLTSSLVQLDCYGSNDLNAARSEAAALSAAVRAAVANMPNRTVSGAVITSAKTSASRIPDATLEPARERYIVSAQIAVHP